MESAFFGDGDGVTSQNSANMIHENECVEEQDKEVNYVAQNCIVCDECLINCDLNLVQPSNNNMYCIKIINYI